MPLVDLVVLGDSLVKANRTTVSALVEAVKTWRGWGSRPALRAVGYVRKGVDSPMETRLRMLMVLAGLPEPVVNHIQYDAMGGWARRFDLSYPDLLLVIEYDGRQHALERIADAMRARGSRDVPRRFRNEWRTHFPGRAV